jgi:hypothetical protein
VVARCSPGLGLDGVADEPKISLISLNCTKLHALTRVESMTPEDTGVGEGPRVTMDAKDQSLPKLEDANATMDATGTQL